MHELGDMLLFALSFWHETSWKKFKNCFSDMLQRYISLTGNEPSMDSRILRSKSLRTLSSLGHIDLLHTHSFANNVDKVIVAPTALARLPGPGICKAIVCGARSPDFLGTLVDLAKSRGIRVTKTRQSHLQLLAPTRIELETVSSELLFDLARQLNVKYSDPAPARVIAHYLPSLQDYQSTLRWREGQDINWVREDFSLETFTFRASGRSFQDARLSRYRDPSSSLYSYRLWKDQQFADIDLDLGRYFLSAICGKNVLKYEKSDRTVQIPFGIPLPTLYSRSLALCSGCCPSDNQN